MNAPNCDKFIERIPAYHDGTLPEAGREEVRAHLETCADCREIAGSLRLLAGAMEMSPLPEKLDEKRQAAIVQRQREAVARERKNAFAAILRFPKLRPVQLPWLVPLARVALFIVLPFVFLVAVMIPAGQAPRGSMRTMARITGEAAGLPVPEDEFQSVNGTVASRTESLGDSDHRERYAFHGEPGVKSDTPPPALRVTSSGTLLAYDAANAPAKPSSPPPAPVLAEPAVSASSPRGNEASDRFRRIEDAAELSDMDFVTSGKDLPSQKKREELASARFDVDADAGSPLVMKGLYEGRSSGGRALRIAEEKLAQHVDGAEALAAAPARPASGNAAGAMDLFVDAKDETVNFYSLGNVVAGQGRFGVAKGGDAIETPGLPDAGGGEATAERGLARKDGAQEWDVGVEPHAGVGGQVAMLGAASAPESGGRDKNGRTDESRSWRDAGLGWQSSDLSGAKREKILAADGGKLVSELSQVSRGEKVSPPPPAAPPVQVLARSAPVPADPAAKSWFGTYAVNEGRASVAGVKSGSGVLSLGVGGAGASPDIDNVSKLRESAEGETRRGRPARPAGERAPEPVVVAAGSAFIGMDSSAPAATAPAPVEAPAPMEKLKTEYPKPMFVGTPVPIKLPNLEKPSERGTVATAYANGAYPATREYSVPKSTMDRFDAKDGYAKFDDYLVAEGVKIPPNAKAAYDPETEKLTITARPDTLESFDKAVETLGKKLEADTRDGKAADGLREMEKKQLAAARTDREKEIAAFRHAAAKPTAQAAAVEPVRPSPPRKPAGFNPYIESAADAFSTFGIDVDTASYTLTRQALNEGRLPDPEQVRTEEIVNAFDYDYAPPAGRDAFSIDARLAPSPFRPPLELLRVGIKGSLPGRDAKKAAVLTLVVDSSGSMDTPDRLGRIRTALAMLVEKLQPRDSVAIVAFSTEPRLLLDRTPGTNKKAMRAAIDALTASGSTQLEGGLKLGYEVAARGFVSGAANRVILLSDGVANLGAATAEAILKTVEQHRQQGIYITVLGFGSGNYDDAMLMNLADKGDGMYAFVDSDEEAKRLLVDQWEQTLHVIAKDVKIQVEFNPDRVQRWRQIGYEKRHLKREDFRNDAIDAGEVGSGQSVTALYDIELRSGNIPVPEIGHRNVSGTPIATVRVRYKDPDTGRVTELEQRVTEINRTCDFSLTPARFRVAACAAEFAELLRVSPYTAGTDMNAVVQTLRPAATELRLDQKVQELLRLVQAAGGLAK